MNKFFRAQLNAAPFLCTLFLLASCDQKEVSNLENQDKPTGTALYPTLGATPYPADYPLPNSKLLDISERVSAVVAASKNHPRSEEEMEDYELSAERVKTSTMKMLAIPAGTFLFGSEEDGNGPPSRVRIEPFWMSETEITWHFCRPYIQNGRQRKRDGSLINPKPDTPLVDAISAPTELYHDIFKAGEIPSELHYPAMCMTHHAASKWCQWLSAQTGHFYRLPTEAEWEYACRAGTTTTYYFGNDAKQIDHYAWHASNCDFVYRVPGQKNPNAFGLYDMSGNVAEWVLDGYDPHFRKSLPHGILNPWRIAETRYPRVVKGGSWDHEKEDLTSAARDKSDPDWKNGDPQIPKNIFIHTDAQHVGFRIVRPLKTPSAKEMHLFWNTDWFGEERNKEDS